jgi:hypothetical protein
MSEEKNCEEGVLRLHSKEKVLSESQETHG